MERVKIADPEAVKILMDPSKIRLLAPFMTGACTVAQAAELTGYTQSALLYWVRRFVQLGLLTETGPARPTRFQAITREFLVDPSRVMPLEDLLDQLYGSAWTRMLGGYTREYRRVSEDWFVSLQASPEGLITRREVAAWHLDGPAPDLPLNDWGVIRLSRDRARELQDKLSELVQGYFEASSEDERDDLYVFHLGFVRDTLGG